MTVIQAFFIAGALFTAAAALHSTIYGLVVAGIIFLIFSLLLFLEDRI